MRWSAGCVVRAILVIPRYTGDQVWNKERKEEVLINVEGVALWCPERPGTSAAVSFADPGRAHPAAYGQAF